MSRTAPTDNPFSVVAGLCLLRQEHAMKVATQLIETAEQVVKLYIDNPTQVVVINEIRKATWSQCKD